MEKLQTLTFPSIFAETVRQHPDANALAFAGEKPISYIELNQQIQALIAFLEKLEIHPGDKVAILGTNMPNWGAVYLAITFMGAVAVPLLPDFHPEEIENILNHSGSKAIFASKGLLAKLKEIKAANLEFQCCLEDFRVCKTGDSPVLFYPLASPTRAYHVK